MSGRRSIIITEHGVPPLSISDLSFGYRAMFKGDDDEPWKHGWGATPEEARADLLRLEREGLEAEEEEHEEEEW